jgi:hypothetical protein
MPTIPTTLKSPQVVQCLSSSFLPNIVIDLSSLKAHRATYPFGKGMVTKISYFHLILIKPFPGSSVYGNLIFLILYETLKLILV